MKLSSKKLILAIFILLGVFIFFLRNTFILLQTVTLDVETHEIEKIEESLKTGLEFLDEYKDHEVVEKFSLAKQQIVLVDNIKEKAILWNDVKDNQNKQLIYEEIPDSIKYVNSFMIKLNNQPTVIINCDQILGDMNVRILVDTYSYLILKKSRLNAKEITYFPSLDENIKERFLRNQMIKVLLEAYENNDSLENFRFYFEKWQEEVGDKYKSIAEYDWHEGSKEYIKVKAKQLLEEDFNLSIYIEGKLNEYRFFLQRTGI